MADDETITGGCLCRAVRFQFPKSAVTMVAHCHCSMCRKITGALVFTAIMLPVKDLKWDTSEGLKPYSHSPSAYKAIESSPHILRGFCQECGSSLVYYNTKRTEIEILLGSIDDIEGAGFEITRAHWCENEISGWEIGPSNVEKIMHP